MEEPRQWFVIFGKQNSIIFTAARVNHSLDEMSLSRFRYLKALWHILINCNISYDKLVFKTSIRIKPNMPVYISAALDNRRWLFFGCKHPALRKPNETDAFCWRDGKTSGRLPNRVSFEEPLEDVTVLPRKNNVTCQSGKRRREELSCEVTSNRNTVKNVCSPDIVKGDDFIVNWREDGCVRKKLGLIL